MKKKKLLKRIESLEIENTKLRNKYEHLLYIDDRSTILIIRHLYENDKNMEQLLLKAYTTGIVDLNADKYCNECKLPMNQKVEMLEDRSGIRIKYCFDIRKL